jgi:hypothetical protein
VNGRGGAGQRIASVVEPSAPPPRESPAPAEPQQDRIEALTVLLAPGEELEEVRQSVRRGGGRTIETRVLEPRARNEAFEPLRARAGTRGQVLRGWELTVRMPRHAVADFAAALARGPGRVVIERRAAAPAAPRGRAADVQTLRITVLR